MLPHCTCDMHTTHTNIQKLACKSRRMVEDEGDSIKLDFTLLSQSK